MIARQPDFAGRGLNIDLWALPAGQAMRLLDAVSIECFIAYLYEVLLQRAADPSGMTHYRQHILTGKSRRAVARDFLRSREFTTLNGRKQRRALPIDEFVSLTYQDILGRMPDEEGRQTYTRIGSKRGGRDKVERNILKSPEALEAGGGRLARIRALDAYARQAWLLKLPVVGRILRRENELMSRLASIEVQMGGRSPATLQPFAAPRTSSAAAPSSILDTVAQVPASNPAEAAAVSSYKPGARLARIDTLDAGTARKLEEDGWLFRVAVRDARRQEVTKN